MSDGTRDYVTSHFPGGNALSWSRAFALQANAFQVEIRFPVRGEVFPALRVDSVSFFGSSVHAAHPPRHRLMSPHVVNESGGGHVSGRNMAPVAGTRPRDGGAPARGDHTRLSAKCLVN